MHAVTIDWRGRFSSWRHLHKRERRGVLYIFIATSWDRQANGSTSDIPVLSSFCLAFSVHSMFTVTDPFLNRLGSQFWASVRRQSSSGSSVTQLRPRDVCWARQNHHRLRDPGRGRRVRGARLRLQKQVCTSPGHHGSVPALSARQGWGRVGRGAVEAGSGGWLWKDRLILDGFTSWRPSFASILLGSRTRRL